MNASQSFIITQEAIDQEWKQIYDKSTCIMMA